MSAVSLLALTPAVVLSCMAVVELFFRLPFIAQVEAVNKGALTALGVVRSAHISDHWKERVLPTYAGRILRASLLLGGLLLSCGAVFAVVWTLAAWWPAGSVSDAFANLGRPAVQAYLIAVGIAWAVLRARLGRRAGSVHADYSASSQMLHRLALSNAGMRSLCDDLDQRLAGARVEKIAVERPVYVASLARAGTTVVLEALYASGRFASLTYRAMPFVMAPWIWGAVSRPERAGKRNLRERAHGDRLQISVDSPEAFEEVFWMTYAERAIRDVDGLRVAESASDEVLDRYRSYVRRILARDAGAGSARRYLCKNNNNLLRFSWLREAFPDALIITPFRNPADHVSSLMRQHRRFVERHKRDPFSLEYMDWLGHHEFGAHFLPFKLGPEAMPPRPDALLSPGYWVGYWTAVYRYLLAEHGGDLIWFDYDGFCDQPADALESLEESLVLPAGCLQDFAGQVSRSEREADAGICEALTPECLEVYSCLRRRAGSPIC